MKKILITGGAGFIGSHTAVALFESGYLPVIVDNFSNSEATVLKGIQKICDKEFSFYEGDCTDADFLQHVFKSEENIEGVIHFAASKAVGESVEKPLEYYYNNIQSLITLLNVMNDQRCSLLVFSSSCTVYGQPDKLPVTEVTPKKQAESPYGNTKRICEEIIEDTVKSGALLKAINLRYFNPVGAHPSALIGELPLGVPNNLIPFITQTAAGMREKLMVFGDDYSTPDGTAIRDYIHVMDLAEAHVATIAFLEKTAETSYSDVINVGTGHGNSVMEVIQAFEEVSGDKLSYQIGPRRSGDIEMVYANADKSQSVLGWKAKRSLKEALDDAWRWQGTLKSK